MSRRNKLQKFAELTTFPHVFEDFNREDRKLNGANGQFFALKGRWGATVFKNDHPLVLELACGYGEYTVALAAADPARNFVGVDIKGNRIWRGAKTALEETLPNAAFLRTRIERIDDFFDTGEVDEIWITFPDPFLKKSKSNRRLTSPPFLSLYRKILKPGGLLHLKTDEGVLSEFTLNTLHYDPEASIRYSNPDIYAGELIRPELAIPTRYERIHQAKGKTIKYIQFTIN